MSANDPAIRTADSVYREGLYRTLAGIMAAILLSVLGSWFAFGRDAVSSSEVRNLIALNSPYALDRGAIQSRLDNLTAESLRTTAEKDKLEAEVSQLEITVSRNNNRLTELERRTNRLEARERVSP